MLEAQEAGSNQFFDTMHGGSNLCVGFGLQEFQELWAEYDDGSGTIAPEQLQALLIRTDPPLGLGRMATGRDVLKFVFNLDIPLVNGRVSFHRTVYELVRNVSETQIPEVLHAMQARPPSCY